MGSIYEKEVRKFSLLTKEKENKLHKDFSATNTKSRNELITSNLRLVISIANNYRDKGVDIDELICEGNKGLVIAATKFNPSFDCKFSTYAYFWIRQAVIEAIKNNSIWNPKASTNIYNYEDYYSDKELMVDMDEYENSDQEDNLGEVLQFLDGLPKRDSKILKHYFGINNHQELNTSELSEKFNISSMRVSGIIEKSIRKIRCNLFEKQEN